MTSIPVAKKPEEEATTPPLLDIAESTDSDAFSDFQGVLQKRFNKNIGEKHREIQDELNAAGVI